MDMCRITPEGQGKTHFGISYVAVWECLGSARVVSAKLGPLLLFSPCRRSARIVGSAQLGSG